MLRHAEKLEGGSWLPRISVGRPVTVLMLVLALLLLGGVALLKLPVQLMPSGFDPTFMMVRVPYPGANPAEVEEDIVLPLEEAMATVRGLKDLNCGANNDGARCWMEFHNHVDMQETYNQVADRIERLRATTWPDDIERVWIRKFNPNNDPNLTVNIPIPEGVDDPFWLFQNRVVNRLERVPGVAQVDLEGVVERQIFIEPDRNALESHRVGLWNLVQALRRANFALASGDVRDSDRKLFVRSVARFESLEDIRRIPIRADGLRLDQVADVRYAEPEIERVSRLDGRAAAVIEIFKESEANTVAVTEAARAELDRILADEPVLAAAGGFQVLFDQGEVIRDSIGELRNAGLMGGLYAVAVLYLFLRRFRVTLLITMAIPLSMLVCLVALYFLGGSLNVVTMLGLLICTGMLVDNAVVVVENIDRLRRDGRSVGRAALDGASELALALTMATGTTVIVFIPIVLISEQGMMRFMLRSLALPVGVSIAASLVVAMLLVPLAASVLLRSGTELAASRPGFVTRAVDALYRVSIEPLHRGYVSALRWSLGHRGVWLGMTVAAILVTWFVPYQGTEVSIQARHQQGGRAAQFWFNLPNSYGIADAQNWFRKVEQTFDRERDALGIQYVQTRFWRNRGMVRVHLRSAEEGGAAVEDAVEHLRKVAPTGPGVQMWVNWQRGSGSDASLNVTMYGEDTRTLADLSDEAERRLRRIPGIASVEPELETASEEVRVRIAREQAVRYGVRPEVVAGTVASALRGQALPRFRDDEREIEIRVQFPEQDREGLVRLASLDIRSDSGRGVPLEAVADVTVTRGYGEIRRENRRTALNIKVNTTWDNLRTLRSEVQGVMDGMALPAGYTWDYGSQTRWERQDNLNMALGLGLSMVFIYLIMGFLFESALLPLAVMPSIVLSWVGVYWMLWSTSTKLDIMAAIGLILLAGVVVNNGIVLVDLINRLRSEGWSRSAAIVEAGRLRFRPILMTATTTIFGMLPMAFGNASFVGIPYAGLGRAFIGGLLSSTALTLFVVPMFYTILVDAGDAVRTLVRGRRAAPADAAA